jgi:leucyl aminopeptidase
VTLEGGLIERSDAARPLWLVTEGELAAWTASQPAAVAVWMQAHGFQAERHRVLTLPDTEGGIRGAVAGLGPLRTLDELTVWHAAALQDRLPPGDYVLATPLASDVATRFVLGWLMGAYRLARYRSTPQPHSAVLLVPAGADLRYATAAASGMALARDLINAPANELGPSELSAAAVALAERFAARCVVLEGPELADYPLVRAVVPAAHASPGSSICAGASARGHV